MANIAEDPRANNEEHTKIIHMTNVISKIAIRLQRITNILTWAKRQARTRITNPRVKSLATVQVASNNGRKCYICNDPNHLANACPQKKKHKQNAKTKLKKNKSFLTLFIHVDK